MQAGLQGKKHFALGLFDLQDKTNKQTNKQKTNKQQQQQKKQLAPEVKEQWQQSLFITENYLQLD